MNVMKLVGITQRNSSVYHCQKFKSDNEKYFYSVMFLMITFDDDNFSKEKRTLTRRIDIQRRDDKGKNKRQQNSRLRT